MKQLLLFSFFWFFFLSSSGQSVINAYAKITAVGGGSVLTLSNVNISNHTFNVGDSVIVMQMQDDVIGTNTTNASTFGDLSSISSAGVFEPRKISAISPAAGTPTAVTLSSMLSNGYNTGANSAVQLISFRNLGANYTTSANITGLAWDGNIGGVIAFYVSNTLVLNHSINCDGLGFRGGSFNPTNPGGDYGCANSTYITTLTTLGGKGEGIYLPTVASYFWGRGKILNGGGGGSENNSGGGGGGNFTAGGLGGLGYPCTPANSGRGLGGISLSGQISPYRIFMGGGGGGGQQNNNVSSNGGNGGGIILIRANTITTSTTCASPINITANGINAANSGNDGAGGGGAAGSILLQVTNFPVNPACPLTVNASGGNGGSVGNSAGHGGGAGGGQGVILYASTQSMNNVISQTANGLPGSDDSNGTTNATGGGGSNNSGVILSPSGALPIELVQLTAIQENSRVLVQWSTASETRNAYFLVEKSINGLDYITVGKITGAGTTQSRHDYSIYDNGLSEGTIYYRLKQVDEDGRYSYSQLVSLNFFSDMDISFFPNPVKKDEDVYLNLGKNSGSGQFSISIYDVRGNKIYSENAVTKSKDQTVYTLQKPGLRDGVYFLKIQTSYSITVKKLLVEQ